jgi:hypothetical protein
VEVFTKGPDKQLSIQHTAGGDTRTALNGSAGSTKSPGRPPRDLHGFDLETARADADLQFALHIKQMFPELRVEYPETISNREAYVVVAIRQGDPPWKFFFDAQSGLLVRLVRYSESPLGLDPTQIDYGDYRPVDDVEVPYLRTISRSGGRTIIRMKEIQQNIAIEDARFANP